MGTKRIVANRLHNLSRVRQVPSSPLRYHRSC
jgi:hypothetical protein